ncbi:hypothetical protein C8Q70DRAFT_378018 [Cubamyces menziesii]|uniref:Uncharacterized protein n=1 Tax=Trametes cubensis TaxID=1111947 RepID=A0AAD7XFA1_9APHY|nr:hypothetical protein C8Q70DRAFT_378018 [Cubamyces menziesii]KAJ8496626.1 hypothetical protein ONZ51_g1023 [Trametes cubensis]
MIPKYANPLLLPDQTAVVSRAALRDSDDESEPGDHADPERAQMLARLENILKRSIEDVLPTSVQHIGGQGEEQKRKKKRRKVEEELKDEEKGERKLKEDEPVAVPFRLFSGMSQPKPIVLAPKAPPVIVPIGPSYEDTEQEAERRAARAREIAVDFAWVMSESSKPYVPLPNAAKKLKTIVASLPSSPPPLLLLERPKPTPKPPRVALLDPDQPVEPSPHQHEVSTSCCPIIVAESPDTLATRSASKRKRRRAKTRERPAVQPAFWRPQEGMGGKSLGYAWGYPGSWPAAEGETRRYYRDTMRKAEYA